MVEIFARRVAVGLRLVDRLSGGPPIGAVRATADDPFAVGFRVSSDRWVFERLTREPTRIEVRARHYVPETLSVDLPSDPGAAPRLDQVSLWPRTGYPFSPTLTRVFGRVQVALGDHEIIPAGGAQIDVTPRYRRRSGTARRNGPVVTTRTTDDGDYTMWFLPQTALPPRFERLPFECRVQVTLIHEGTTLRPPPTTVALTPRRATSAPLLTLTT